MIIGRSNNYHKYASIMNVMNEDKTFFKVVQPTNKCLRPRLCSLKWRAYSSNSYGLSLDWSGSCILDEHIALLSVGLLLYSLL